MKLAWITDPHLNFLDYQNRCAFYAEILQSVHGGPDAVMISGDIGEADSVKSLLIEMVDAIHMPIYFVLGNHDFYTGSVKDVREEMRVSTMRGFNERLFWLGAITEPYIPTNLTKGVSLVGVDGFADARNGNYQKTPVRLNDQRYIKELAESLWEEEDPCAGITPLFKKMRELADADAKTLSYQIEKAIEIHSPNKIIVLTHVPPFPECSFYRGKQSDPDFQPFYSSKAIGDVLTEYANKYPDLQFDVYCGHTHGEVTWNRGNLTVNVGGTEYRYPSVQKIINV